MSDMSITVIYHAMSLAVQYMYLYQYIFIRKVVKLFFFPPGVIFLFSFLKGIQAVRIEFFCLY